MNIRDNGARSQACQSSILSEPVATGERLRPPAEGRPDRNGPASIALRPL